MSSSGHVSPQPRRSQEEESAPGESSKTPPAVITNAQVDTIPAPHIEAGDDHDGSDDGYDTASIESSTASLSSSVMAGVWEHGRRYNKFREGQYVLPNDEGEQNREDMKHAMTVMLMDGALHFADIGEHPQNIIDLGTGTGIWALDVADKYPSALVEGLDLSPIQPSWVAPNAKFVIDDVEDPWTYPTDHFDLVHLRVLTAHMKNIPKLFDQSYNSDNFRHLKPGAWIEIQDHENTFYCDDGSMPEDYTPKQMFSYVQQGLALFGKDTTAMLSVDDKLVAAGFTNITHRIFKLPVGPWAKDKKQKMLGLFWRTIIMDGLQGIALGILGRALKWSPEEVEVYLVDIRKQMMRKDIHTYWPYHVVTAQKPLT
ncbi:related to methyltransferase [Phialocephala subalpina]|uniref:Related to methyltransferase n=1 Tax=Phialocephala subalpina TaxID=576137 RepID=A0A1L7XGG0_9HELO|nr:related to methyltransferase [Phialocephala subalpina]